MSADRRARLRDSAIAAGEPLRVVCVGCGEGAEIPIVRLRELQATDRAPSGYCRRCRGKRSRGEPIMRTDRLPTDRPHDRQCVDCGSTFSIDAESLTYYRERDWQIPVRCCDCRRARREAQGPRRQTGRTHERTRAEASPMSSDRYWTGVTGRSPRGGGVCAIPRSRAGSFRRERRF